MNAPNEKIFVIIAAMVVIIAGSIIIIWMAYKYYRRRTKNNYNEISDVEIGYRNSFQPCQDKMTQTSLEEFNEKKVIFRSNRKNHSIYRCSETGQRFEFHDHTFKRLSLGFSQNRDSGYPTSRSSYQSSSLQVQSSIADYQKQTQPVQLRIVPSFYDNVLPDLSIVDNCYDVSGDNHILACTIIKYNEPLDDRISAVNDHNNLENSMKRRGYIFSPYWGTVTLEGFRNELLTKLSRISSNTTSFILSISCHGDGNKLVFSDGKKYVFSYRN